MHKAYPEAEVALLPLDSLLFGQQPNGRTYLAFKLHRNTTRTAINDDNLGLKTVRNKWKKKGIINIVTWNVCGIAFKEDQLDDILAKKILKLQLSLKQKRNAEGLRKQTTISSFIMEWEKWRGPKL
jgi:hypothetical protein